MPADPQIYASHITELLSDIKADNAETEREWKKIDELVANLTALNAVLHHPIIETVITTVATARGAPHAQIQRLLESAFALADVAKPSAR
jgi:hypothetical protein